MKYFLNFHQMIFNLQIQVQAADNGFPSLTSTVFVDISITRTTEFLAFSSNNYVETISENALVGSSVLNVFALPGVGQHSLNFCFISRRLYLLTLQDFIILYYFMRKNAHKYLEKMGTLIIYIMKLGVSVIVWL